MRRMRLSKSCQSLGRFLRETDDADFKNPYLCYTFSVRESGGMADAPDLGSGAARRGGSSPPSRITGSIRAHSSFETGIWVKDTSFHSRHDRSTRLSFPGSQT